MDLFAENGFCFCPGCGAVQLHLKGKRLICKVCDFTYYQNVATGVGVIVSRRGNNTARQEILLTVRAREPRRGYYDFPGGFVDPGENLEMALMRELREELGSKLPKKLGPPCYLFSAPNIYYYKNHRYEVCDVFFSASLETEVEIIAADDVETFIWCGAEHIDLERMAFPSTKAALQHWLQKHSHNNSRIVPAGPVCQRNNDSRCK